MVEYFEREVAPQTRTIASPWPTSRSKRRSSPEVPPHRGRFARHEEESKRVDWSHEIAPWIVFFQNVGDHWAPTSGGRSRAPDGELDYELELAVVVKRSGRWFGPADAADYIGGYVIFNDVTARDIQRREMRSGSSRSARRSTPSVRSGRGS